jgi:hypothetical protein
MKKLLFTLLLLSIVSTQLIACTPKEETPEDVLQRMQLDSQAYDKLSACQQIEIFAEVGYKFMDIDHMYVNVPKWIYESIRKHGAHVNASCIKGSILKYFTVIGENPVQQEESSLKIHALIYLASSLDLLTDQDIIDMLKLIVCERKILDSENFTVIYFLTKSRELPSSFTGKPEDLEQLQIEACKT